MPRQTPVNHILNTLYTEISKVYNKRQYKPLSFLPKKGFFCVRAQLIARIFPSMPRIPKPPGTKTPLEEEINSQTSNVRI